MNRRSALAALGGVTLLADTKRIGVAVFGGSHSHALEKVKILQSSPEYQLAGIWEENPKVMERYKTLGVPAIRPEDVLKNDSIQLIVVESAVGQHGRHAEMALAAGKHVHVEKPPSDSLPQMKKLVQLARDKKLLLQSGYMWRYNPGINAALEAARKGWLGEIYMVRGTISTLIEPNRRPEWGEFAGGHMFELCSHLIDPITRLMGRPEKVTPFIRKSGRFNDSLHDNTVAVFEYPSAMAVVQGATLQPSAGRYRSLEIMGTKGTAVVRPAEPPALSIDLAEAAGPYAKGPQDVKQQPYQRYVADFVEMAAALRGEKELSVSLDQEYLVEETLLRASGM